MGGKASGHVDGKVYYGASKKASQQQQQQRSGLGLGTAAAAAFAASPMAAFARSGGADMVQSASNTLLPPTDLSLLRLETDFMGFGSPSAVQHQQYQTPGKAVAPPADSAAMTSEDVLRKTTPPDEPVPTVQA